MKASCDRYATVVSLSWVARPESTPLRGLAGCMARGLSPRIEVPASLWHERGNHQVVDRGFCWNLWNPECNFKYFSPPSTNVKLETKGLMLWINSWEMNVAKSLLNRREEVRGIWWFCFFCFLTCLVWAKDRWIAKPCCVLSFQDAWIQKELVTV